MITHLPLFVQIDMSQSFKSLKGGVFQCKLNFCLICNLFKNKDEEAVSGNEDGFD